MAFWLGYLESLLADEEEDACLALGLQLQAFVVLQVPNCLENLAYLVLLGNHRRHPAFLEENQVSVAFRATPQQDLEV